ncbi:amidase [Salipiger aestuarii]|uniref:amidase n=1 Tax=Salipiger aestuarii TaxID=568098 RepID=UPI00025B6505|nr:amidase [Salipiger aestuarii]EIE50272.1 amidase [Citreicella sp. 357]KAA8605031.1 amidase [Salipiger aestuarii]KAA8606431.1 amidase [Salipiger aestuarii]
MADKQTNWRSEIAQGDAELHSMVCIADDLPEARPPRLLGVKDIIDVAGLPTECGSLICEGQIPPATAPCVTALRGAGATVLGKTVTTEYATTRPGPTRNPLNPAHSPGGSSSGSAAGVAAGYFDWALGTQTGGSVIRPAAFCGIVGFLPSAGVIPRAGVRVMSPTLDRVGIFARSVAEISEMLAAYAVAPTTSPSDRPLRLALLPQAYLDQCDAATQSLIDGAVTALRATGAVVDALEDTAPFDEMMAAQMTVSGYEIPRALEWERKTHPDLLSDELRDYCEASAGISHVDYAAALETADRFRLWGTTILQQYDAFMGPAAAGLAPEGLGWTGDPFVNRIWSLSKFPAVCLPGAAVANGLKASVQFNTATGTDARLCALAAQLEALVAGLAPD